MNITRSQTRFLCEHLEDRLTPATPYAVPFVEIPEPQNNNVLIPRPRVEAQVVGNLMYYTIAIGLSEELWRTDGTTAGTIKLATSDAPGNAYRGFTHLTEFKGKLVFAGFTNAAGFELWSSDGTVAGTKMITDLRPGPQSGLYAQLTTKGAIGTDGNFVYFSGTDGKAGYNPYRSDGTAAGTQIVSQLLPLNGDPIANWPLIDSQSSVTDNFVAGKSGMYFRDIAGNRVFRTNGFSSGTEEVRFNNESIGLRGSLTAFNGDVYFSAFALSGVSGDAFVKTDENSVVVLVSGLRLRGLTGDTYNIGGKLYFNVFPPDLPNLNEIWTTDGTPSGTKLAVQGPFTTSNGFTIAGLNNQLVFTDTGKLWITDFANQSAKVVKEFAPGIGELTEANGKVFFGARQEPQNIQSSYVVWTTDGTENGTQPVRAGQLGTVYQNSSLNLFYPNTNLSVLNGVQYFTASRFTPAGRIDGLWKIHFGNAPTISAISPLTVPDRGTFTSDPIPLTVVGDVPADQISITTELRSDFASIDLLNLRTVVTGTGASRTLTLDSKTITGEPLGISAPISAEVIFTTSDGLISSQTRVPLSITPATSTSPPPVSPPPVSPPPVSPPPVSPPPVSPPPLSPPPVSPPPTGIPEPELVGTPLFAIGSDFGDDPTVQFFNPDASERFTIQPFPSNFTGGVRTASGDFNNDGIADLVVGTGPGASSQVRVLDGKTQAEVFALAPFESSFVGGVYVSAGDLNGDGVADLVISPDEGGGPRVRVFSGNGFSPIIDFFGIDDTNFRGGARSNIGDLNGDGVGDLIVVAGFGGGPRTAGFDGKSLRTGSPVKIFGDFFAFEQGLRNGVFVAVGDINGDGFADLVAGGGPGGGPRVLVFSGKSLIDNQYTPLANFFGGDTASRGGIRVSVKNLDGDSKADLIVGSGAGSGGRATAYFGKTITTSGTPPVGFELESESSNNGIFVG